MTRIQTQQRGSYRNKPIYRKAESSAQMEAMLRQTEGAEKDVQRHTGQTAQEQCRYWKQGTISWKKNAVILHIVHNALFTCHPCKAHT